MKPTILSGDSGRPAIDVIYIAASARDARFTRICVASVRYFYPDARIRLLPGGKLQRSLVDELRRYWDADVADLPAGDYGWGFVKLEPLFGRPGETFLVLDSDTAMTGVVLDSWRGCAEPFLVDDEQQTAAETARLYYQWEQVRKIDDAAAPPEFVFNSGQWFGTAGVLTRDDFSPWLLWTMPRRLRHPECFMPGDQGILNYVLNQKAKSGTVGVARRKIMRWPGHTLDGLDAKTVADRAADPLIVHWAGMKKARHKDMKGADLLAFFERAYYKRLPTGATQRVLAAWSDVVSNWTWETKVRLTLASRRLVGNAGGVQK